MKKSYKIEELDCANCAAKMENAIKKIEGIIFVNVNFIAQKITIEAKDDMFEDCLKKSQKVCKKIEPDCKFII